MIISAANALTQINAFVVSGW